MHVEAESIKFSLAKGEGDSNENMELKYGRRWKQYKDVENELPPNILRNSQESLQKWGNLIFHPSIYLHF